MPSIEGFKRAFQKVFKSSGDNYQIRRAKVAEAVNHLERAVAHMKKELKGDLARSHEDELKRLQGELAKADKVAERAPGDAFKLLDKVKADARTAATAAQNAAKKVPKKLVLTDGSQAKVFPNDIPGFENMNNKQREEIAVKVGEKITKGKALFAQISKNKKLGKMFSPTPEDVADMMWFIKTKAEEKIGEAYERGALTIPDPDNRLREMFDKCSAVYARDSSHMNNQQKKTGGQARGMDFYEGVNEGEIGDVGKLLPSGMRTVLLQQVETAKGEKRLYIKMETESARLKGKFWKKKFWNEEVESRPREAKDYGRSLLHLGNLIKAKLGMSQGEDPTLRAFREKVPSDIKTLFETAVKSAKAKSPQAHKIIEKAGKGGIQAMFDAFDQIREAGVPLDADTFKAINECAAATFEKFGTEDLDSRIGEEVVVEMDDLLPPPEEEEPPLDKPRTIELLSVSIRNVGACAHTDELSDLRRVLTAAKAALEKADGGPLKDDVLVKSTARQLQGKLPPLKRLISQMEVDAGDTTAVLGTLAEQTAEVEACQHTDDLADLKEVFKTAATAVQNVKKNTTFFANPMVKSTVLKLEEKLKPLGRLIVNMEKK